MDLYTDSVYGLIYRQCIWTYIQTVYMDLYTDSVYGLIYIQTVYMDLYTDSVYGLIYRQCTYTPRGARICITYTKS